MPSRAGDSSGGQDSPAEPAFGPWDAPHPALLGTESWHCSPLKIEVQGGFSEQVGVAQNHFLHPTALPCSLSSLVLPFPHGLNPKMPILEEQERGRSCLVQDTRDALKT